MSESQNMGGIHYDVSMDIKELLVGEKQVNKVMDNVEKSTDKATSSLNKLDKVDAQDAIIKAKKIMVITHSLLEQKK